jgi:hypothetical protein
MCGPLPLPYQGSGGFFWTSVQKNPNAKASHVQCVHLLKGLLGTSLLLKAGI